MSWGGSVLDSDNSTSTPLDGAATFTGNGVDVQGYGTVGLFVDSDVDGTLYAQWSADGTNWDRSKAFAVDITYASGHTHTLPVEARYFRAVYVNGASAQTHFRLQVLLHIQRTTDIHTSSEEVITGANDVRLSRIINDIDLDIARGLHSDRYSVHKFGTNPDVGTTAFEDVWSVGGVYPWPTVAETLRVKAGGNVADAAAGAGARSITIEGLDQNWSLASEVLTLNADGTLASAPTTTTFVRVFRAYVDTCGTYSGTNVGNINIENTVSANVLAQIEAGFGQTRMAIYTIPLGYRGYLTQVLFEVDSTKDAEMRVVIREGADTVAAPFEPARSNHGVLALSGPHDSTFGSPIVLGEKTDVWVSALATGANTRVSAHFDLVMVYHDGGPTTPQ